MLTGCEVLELSYIAVESTKWYNYFGKLEDFLIKLNIQKSYDSKSHSKRNKTYVQTIGHKCP